MKDISNKNKIAWEFNSYEFWCQYNGKPNDYASRIVSDPIHPLRRHIKLLGDVKGKKIANPLGSNGRKAIPLALLGADVTLIDISKGNLRYAEELAKESNVSIRLELCDFLEFDTSKSNNNDYDILYLEGGIIHYFDDIQLLMNKLFSMLRQGGFMVLNDFHPFRKVIKVSDGRIKLNGNYFDQEIKEGEVAYAQLYEGIAAKDFPKCMVRYYTMGEIITSVAKAGFRINRLVEEERYDEFKEIPGNFTILATK